MRITVEWVGEDENVQYYSVNSNGTEWVTFGSCGMGCGMCCGKGCGMGCGMDCGKGCGIGCGKGCGK